jgi:hypothetical protein
MAKRNRNESICAYGKLCAENWKKGKDRHFLTIPSTPGKEAALWPIRFKSETILYSVHENTRFTRR